jgi:hypothetical protein
MVARSLRIGLVSAVSVALLAGCQGKVLSRDVAPVASAPAPSSTPSAAPTVAKLAPSRSGCESIPVYAAGVSAGSICVEDAEKNGLTVLDLSDTWTPRVFAEDAETHDAPEYRAKYLELAREPNSDLGLYGIAPTLSVTFDRLNDDKRRACDEALDLSALREVESNVTQAPDAKTAEVALKKAASGPALKAVQGLLVCAGFMKPAAATGVMSASTQSALEAFRRRHMIVGSALDADTLHALSIGGEELAFRAVLRGLRERVAESVGILEDGTASESRETVVGRDIDLSRFAPALHEALDGGAPDLVDLTADAAARELGWESPEAARAFFAAQGKDGVHKVRVAVKLPAKPSYYSAAMDLHVEVDRGDVFHETPGAAAAAKKKLGTVRSPTFVLYAKDGDHDVPLMRWATTIGGWKKELTEDGEVALKYKESDVGDRVWRQVIAAPAWMPPNSTPETDLLHESKDGTIALKRDLIQPGYRNAYGLVMMIHDEVIQKGDKTTYADHGIRTHGSVDYRSIQHGTSHGCHRLYNQLALRLSGFVLAHRNHVRRGKMNVGYHRTLEHNDQTIDVEVTSRGYLYEVDPPVPVRVLQGNIVGEAQKPVSVIAIKTDEPKKG